MTRHQKLFILGVGIALSLLSACHASSHIQDSTPYPPTEKIQELAQVVSPNNISNKANPVTPMPRSFSHTERMAIRLDSLMTDPFLATTQLGFYVYDLTDDCSVYERGKLQRMRPASTMKVLTAVTALDQLGANYNYSTSLFIDGNIKGKKLSGNLYVRGGFDPLFGPKGMNAFVNALAQRGIRKIEGHLVVDLSMKDDKEAGMGWCWDDRNPSLSPLLYKGKDDFAANFIKALRNKGISITSKMTRGRVPASAALVYNHQTDIAEVLEPMMKESVNQDAESMFYQIAAQGKKTYANRKDAERHIKQFIKEALQLNADNYYIADGSGLSLYDYLTPELLVMALKYAYEHKDIYEPLLVALPIAGVDGTLENRLIGTAAYRNVCAKTGTLTGICSLAGYATASNGHRLCFSIINQGQRRSSEARIFQDKVCKILTE